MSSTPDDVLLTIEDLSIDFTTDEGTISALRGVTFNIKSGRTLALLGESGCGKSVTARAVLNLIDPPGRITDGTIRVRDREDQTTWTDILALSSSGSAMQAIRWRDISMIFQDPRNALTPAYTIGEQIAEALRLHERLHNRAARQRAEQLLFEVGIPAPKRRLDDYPHQLSGGMCQRVMIAMALACKPRLIIADEPTTALDVTIQAQVLELLSRMQQEHGSAILLITHDIGVVAELADDVAVMYLGRIVESGPVDAIFETPQHPYTQGLFASTPHGSLPRGKPLATIPGSVPSLQQAPVGCGFRGRCEREFESCSDEPPTFTFAQQAVKCWLPAQDGRDGQ